MTILVHTYWFSPNKGSEFSVAYNYVKQMSQRHKLYVIVGSCSYKFGDYSELEDLKIQNVDFILVKPNRCTNNLIKLYNRLV
jgi:hypothetical protein